MVDDLLVAAAIHPGLAHGRREGGHAVKHLPADRGVGETRRGEPEHDKQPEGVTAMCRLRPLVFLLPSNRTVSGAALPEALTVCESTATAVGSSARPRERRTLRRSRSWNCSVVPSSRQAAKYP